MRRIHTPTWMGQVLLAGGIYNLAWGLSVVVFPSWVFDAFQLPQPNYLEFWQALGMVTAVFGMGYVFAARDPIHYWVVVLMGTIAKIAGLLGFLYSYVLGDLPLSFGLTVVADDLLWLVPFLLILRHAAHHALNEPWLGEPPRPESVLTSLRTDMGETPARMSRRGPVLLVCLRHSGCTFCRAMMSRVQRSLRELTAMGITVVLVTPHDSRREERLRQRYGVNEIPLIVDPDRVLYRSLGLRRGTIAQLIGPRQWIGTIRHALFGGHGMGVISGDPFQLHGIFLIRDGQLIRAQRSRFASELFDLVAFCKAAGEAGDASTGEARKAAPAPAT